MSRLAAVQSLVVDLQQVNVAELVGIKEEEEEEVVVVVVVVAAIRCTSCKAISSSVVLVRVFFSRNLRAKCAKFGKRDVAMCVAMDSSASIMRTRPNHRLESIYSPVKLSQYPKTGDVSISSHVCNSLPSFSLYLSASAHVFGESNYTYTFIVDNRTYHFQADEEDELSAWMSVLVNSKEGALMKAFDDNGRHGPKVNQGFIELQQAIIRYILRLPGNDRCADCCSQNGKCYSTLYSTLLLPPPSGGDCFGLPFSMSERGGIKKLQPSNQKSHT